VSFVPLWLNLFGSSGLYKKKGYTFMTTPSPDPFAEMKALNRQVMRLAWQMAEMGAQLEGEEKRLVDCMRLHPEYARLWERLDGLSEREIEADGTNPILHIQIHATVENQLEQDSPAGVREIVEELLGRGISRHDAVHAVGSVLIQEIYGILKEQRAFEPERYLSDLHRLISR
jgi:hypothetical protein